MKDINRGFFDQELIDELEKLNNEALREDTIESLDQAWPLYHNSLENNSEQLISALKDSYYQNADNIPIG